MRLLTWNSQNELILTDDLDDENIPPYCILSHTWGLDREEVTFADIQNGEGQSKPGYAKIQFCGKQARKDGIQHFWVDTCCINKGNPNELTEAINSMFRWYRQAEKCYVYLPDVSFRRDDNPENARSVWEPSLQSSRWFRRGWTLQELLAPAIVEFFSSEGDFLSTKRMLAELIHELTTIPIYALHGAPLAQFPIDEKIRWVEGRQTKKVEDGAYCLLGIFDVFMPFVYGERENAFRRLREEINKKFGNDVASRLGIGGPARLSGVLRGQPSQNDFDELGERATQISPTVQTSYLDEGRPSKRVRISHHTETSGTGNDGTDSHTAMSTPPTGITDDQVQQRGEVARIKSTTLDEGKYNDLLKSLLFDRIDFRVNNIKRALLSTCEWLFTHSKFQTWYKSGRVAQLARFLWIKGKPGCGKSTLMKATLEWLRKRKVKGRIIIPYFFNARAAASLEKSSLGLYRTIVYQLLSSNSNLRTLFVEKFAFKDPGPLGGNWTTEELQEFLYDTVESDESLRLCLLIDALDEAEYEDDVQQLISFLVRLSERASALGSLCELQICLSSRHYPHINIGRELSLVVEEQPEHGQDINTYITKELTCLDGSEKEDLGAELSSKSAHIFLWVVLVVRILNKLDDRGASLPEMKARLKAIPADLHELFEEILKKTNDGIETCMLFFQWMVFRMRPLGPAELFFAVQHSQSSKDPTHTLCAGISVPAPDRLAKFILDCSRGLVEVVETAPSQPATVQFIHETVREFLLKENGLASISPALAKNLVGNSHEILRQACLRCILTHDIPEEYKPYCKASHKSNALWEKFKSETRLKLPFLEYAVLHTFDHAEQAQKHGVSQQAFLKNQIDANCSWLDSNRLWWNVFERYKSKKIESDVTLVYFLVKRQCSNLLSDLLSVSNHANTICGKRGAPLSLASYLGSEDIVLTLLDHGADVDFEGGQYDNALYSASWRGHEKIVQILLDRGANVNPQGGEYGNPVQAALWWGHVKVAQILLDRDADMNAQGGVRDGALYSASWRGREEVVRMLLARGADANAQGGYYGNALQGALQCGHEKVAVLLVDHGADVNMHGGKYTYPIQAASYHGYEKVVRMLLARGADANAQGGYYGNALQEALQCGHEKVALLLLDHGAEANAQGGPGGYPLQAAALRGYEKIVQKLLDRNADVNAQGGYYGNALQAASLRDHEKVVQILLDRDADVSAQGGEYGSALQAASYHGHEKTVQLLLDHGADVNAQGGRFGCALQTASYYGHEKTVQVLLDHGADVNAQGGKHGNALQAALEMGHEEVVEVLLKYGAVAK